MKNMHVKNKWHNAHVWSDGIIQMKKKYNKIIIVIMIIINK